MKHHGVIRVQDIPTIVSQIQCHLKRKHTITIPASDALNLLDHRRRQLSWTLKPFQGKSKKDLRIVSSNTTTKGAIPETNALHCINVSRNSLSKLLP